MAKAFRFTRTEIVKQEFPDGVSLELTHEEARVLKIILGKVAGHPGSTLRGYQSRISDVLEDAGYKYNSADMESITGSLVFTNNTLGISPTEPPFSASWSF